MRCSMCHQKKTQLSRCSDFAVSGKKLFLCWHPEICLEAILAKLELRSPGTGLLFQSKILSACLENLPGSTSSECRAPQVFHGLGKPPFRPETHPKEYGVSKLKTASFVCLCCITVHDFGNKIGSEVKRGVLSLGADFRVKGTMAESGTANWTSSAA